ncbi:hypothetical protein TRFO_03259 [Tritrichomonas foetus]|uniref:Leucine Rich Repeat family protein n=1 Tax=Tritrichomonas foetus TaxID=1144522 RepID=A0A1J4KQF0_9EUKA|nr:hypothetical protein TRFO_03259 [Tritrichomonas foetus]|eukprot:OHT13529.1 hypothetical protein TRFO_03259 [Tritrichomonas foetus]
MSQLPPEKFAPSMLGSNVVMKENPFIVDDISGKQNKILNSIKTPTNCLVYRNQPPTIHIIGSEYPAVLNINQRDLSAIPAIPDSIRILLIRENAVKSLRPLSGHPSLEVLDASQNLIERVEFDVVPLQIRALLLASNAISKISTNCMFDFLEVLNLSGNRLTEFDFYQFPFLKSLNLSCNSFIRFELYSPTLLELSIQNNSLSEFIVVNAESLTHLDISNNYLTDISIIEKVQTLTHLTGIGNKFQDNWASFAVHAIPSIEYINGRKIKEGERAIHRDRVAKFIKSTQAPHPHKKISKIRNMMRQLKDITVQSIETTEDIEDIWIARSKEKGSRMLLVETQSKQIPCISTTDDEGCLTIYGALLNDDYSKQEFRTLKLQFVPILPGSEVVQYVMNLAQKNPSMLTLDHNMLSSVSDMLFLTAFETVEVLRVEGNPIMRFSLFRPLMSYLMPSLQVINGMAITTAEKMSGIDHFQNLLRVTRGIYIETGLEDMMDQE